MFKKLILSAALVLGMAAVSHAVTLRSGYVPTGLGTQRLNCYVTNVGNRPVTNIEFKLFKYNGTELATSTFCPAELAPEETCLATPQWDGLAASCRVSAKGKISAKVVVFEDNGTGDVVAVIPATK